MVEQFDLSNQARAIPKDERAKFLTECPETELHSHLAALFDRAEKNTSAEITHGPDEYGRDLVLRRVDPYGVQYTGIVVKRIPDRRLTGRSAGPVDEMISQAKQVTVHPCQLKEISTEQVHITDVWIALFAKLSSNAMQRLKAETKDVPGIRILALDQLVELFSEHYPHIFFEGGIGEYLTDKILELDNWRSISNREVKLSDAFVKPTVTEADTEINLVDEGLSFVFANKRLPFAHLEEYISDHSILLLTGDPGIGKSTTLRKIAIDRLSTAHRTTRSFTSASKGKDTSNPISIPVLINAVHTRRGTTITELIKRQLPP